MAQVRIPGHARIWKLPPSSPSPGGWCTGDSSLQISNAKIHRHWTWREPGKCRQFVVGIVMSCSYLPSDLHLKRLLHKASQRGRRWVEEGLQGRICFLFALALRAKQWLLASWLKLAVSPTFYHQPRLNNRAGMTLWWHVSFSGARTTTWKKIEYTFFSIILLNQFISWRSLWSLR